eukprot:3239990-Amphidinium_carterae.1
MFDGRATDMGDAEAAWLREKGGAMTVVRLHNTLFGLAIFGARLEEIASGYEPNTPGRVFNPFAPAVREQLALESSRAQEEDALSSEMVPLGGLGQMTQTFSLLTPPQSRVATPAMTHK